MKHFGILLALLPALIFSSCAKKEAPKLTFAVGGAPSELAFWEQISRDFTAQTQIPVTILRQPPDTDQRRQNILTALQSRQKNPDIFLMDVAWTAQFAASHWLEPLDPWMEQSQFPKNVLFEKILNLADTLDGKTVALPIYLDGGVLYYRKDLLEKYGDSAPPKTWDELREISLKIQMEERKTDPDFFGFVWQGAQTEGMICNFLEFAASANGGLGNLSGTVFRERTVPFIVNTPENQKAATLMQSFIHTDKISPLSTFTDMREEQCRQYFEAGHALFERNWPYAWVLHQKEGSPVRGKIGIAPLPHFEGGQSASTLGGWHAGISVSSDMKKEAWQFAEFLLSYDVQKRLALDIGWNPSRRDVYQDADVLTALPHFESLRHVFENTVPRPPVPYWTQLSEVLQRRLNAVLGNAVSADLALSEAEKEIHSILERYQSE